MNNIGEYIDIEAIKSREFDLQELHRIVAGSGLTRAASWGFHNAYIIKKNKVYRFTVSGHHHKGHVYIILNGLDLFDIYYTSNRGKIKKINNDVYIQDLIETLDIEIERIAEYVK